MAHRGLEPLTESPHRLNPALALYSQPVENRRERRRNAPLAALSELAAGLIQKREIVFQRNREKSLV